MVIKGEDSGNYLLMTIAGGGVNLWKLWRINLIGFSALKK